MHAFHTIIFVTRPFLCALSLADSATDPPHPITYRLFPLPVLSLFCDNLPHASASVMLR
eukprot:m.231694 g.231694  ORF g.231694 m.231694 type:complete len:59 (-) comp15222_c0_seq2:25-201(-)